MQKMINKKYEQKKRISPITMLFIITAILLVAGGVMNLFRGQPVPPVSKNTDTGETTLPSPRIPSGVPATLNMGMSGAPTSVTSLQAPLTAAHEKRFTLTAQPARLSLQGAGIEVPAWTFWAGIATMIGSILIQLWLFRRRGWL